MWSVGDGGAIHWAWLLSMRHYVVHAVYRPLPVCWIDSIVNVLLISTFHNIPDVSLLLKFAYIIYPILLRMSNSRR